MTDDLLPGERLVDLEWKPGDQAVWLRRDRGGYGFLVRVPCVVVRCTEKRITIEAEAHHGQKKTASVNREHLVRT